MRATTTINVPTNSPLYVAAVAYAREKKAPMSVAFREVALQAMRDRDAARKDVDDVTARLAGATADLIGDMSTIRQLESEVARLTAAMKNLQAAYDDITARREAEAENHAKELDRANKEIEELREKFREEHFRAKCAQEALAEAKAELETVHAARRAEAEAENHAKELAARKLRTQDLRVTQVALDLLSDHVAALRTRNQDALDGEV